MTRDRAAAAIGWGAIGLAVAPPFFTATTFTGDDHLFLTFARHVRSPLAAFVSDLHGGEYYRPLWMALWWVLGQGDSPWPFRMAALGLHAGAALLLAALLRAVGRPRPVVAGAAVLLLLAPQNLAAAYWFSASTDLLATVFVLSALLAVARGRFGLAALASLAAYLSKESSFVLPLLSALVLWARREGDPSAPPSRRATLLGLGVQALLLAAVCGARRAILHGWGGGGDPRPGLLGTTLQIFGGCAQVFTGDALLPAPAAFAVGATLLALAAFTIARQAGGPARFAPLAFTAVAVAPLVAAGWAVGARYYYLPAVGIVWAAAEAARNLGLPARAATAAVLVVLGLAQAASRGQDVKSYDRRVGAARRAIAAGLRAGHHVFHVDGGIKDLDLAVKEDPALEAGDILVLSDVPASFAIIPARFQGVAAPLKASPPIPPSGAYRFGDVEVVGLARRGDDPDLDEVLRSFPDLRFIRLRAVAGGQVIARDLTEPITRRLDGDPDDGQD